MQENEDENDEFVTKLVENPYDPTNGGAVVHPLHSTAVDKLDVSLTTADDVVKAIKRAQNLHDLHDIREIAHFLLEEVGEL